MTSPLMPTLRGLAAALLAVATIAFSALSPASASVPLHAEMVEATPAAGSTQATVDQVTLIFSEEIAAEFVEVTVLGPNGPEEDGQPVVTGPEVTQSLIADLPPGEHTVTYRVVSVDGHPVSNTFTFTTTNGQSGPASAVEPPANSSASASEEAAVDAASSPVESATAEPEETVSTDRTAVIAGVGVAIVAVLLGLVIWTSRRRDQGAGHL